MERKQESTLVRHFRASLSSSVSEHVTLVHDFLCALTGPLCLLTPLQRHLKSKVGYPKLLEEEIPPLFMTPLPVNEGTEKMLGPFVWPFEAAITRFLKSHLSIGTIESPMTQFLFS